MCATCHSDEKLMADRMYKDRPLGHSQYAQWSGSVHGLAMLEKGDLSAPTCNDCHGNHGALPPEVGSVANACATCHGKVGKLFAETQMKHKFQEVGLPGCATCHGSHDTPVPAETMLGMVDGGVCAECHEEGKYGATLAGGEAAESMRKMMDDLRTRIATAETTIEEAERLGMQVGGPRFDLRQANDALTNARSLIHSFAMDPVKEALDEGNQVVAEVQGLADAALKEHTARRIWLAAFLVPIIIVVVLLVLYIREAFPSPATVQNDTPSGR
jgi:predicted CXXCH cytochrome family protein